VAWPARTCPAGKVRWTLPLRSSNSAPRMVAPPSGAEDDHGFLTRRPLVDAVAGDLQAGVAGESRQRHGVVSVGREQHIGAGRVVEPQRAWTVESATRTKTGPLTTLSTTHSTYSKPKVRR